MVCFEIMPGRRDVFSSERNTRLNPFLQNLVANDFLNKYKNELDDTEDLIRGLPSLSRSISQPASMRDSLAEFIGAAQNAALGGVNFLKMPGVNLASRGLNEAVSAVRDGVRESLAEIAFRNEERRLVERRREELVEQQRKLEAENREREARRMQEEINGLDRRIYRLQEEMNDLDRSVTRGIEELKRSDRELSGRISDVSGEVSSVKSDVRGLERSQENLRRAQADTDRKVAGLDRDLSNLADSTSKGFKQVGKQIDNINANITQLDKNINTLKGVTDNLAADIKTLDKNARKMAGEIGGLQNFQAAQEAKQENELNYVRSRMTQIDKMYQGVGTPIVKKWYPLDYNDVGAKFNAAKVALDNGILPEALINLSAAFQSLSELPKKAYQDEMRQMEQKETIRLMYRSIMENGCKNLNIRQLDPQNPRSVVVIDGELMSGKKIQLQSVLNGKIQVSIEGVDSDREAHSVWDAIEILFGKAGIVVEKKHGEEHTHEQGHSDEAGHKHGHTHKHN